MDFIFSFNPNPCSIEFIANIYLPIESKVQMYIVPSRQVLDTDNQIITNHSIFLKLDGYAAYIIADIILNKGDHQISCLLPLFDTLNSNSGLPEGYYRVYAKCNDILLSQDLLILRSHKLSGVHLWKNLQFY